MTQRAVLVVVISMGIITLFSILAATVLEMASKDATEVWKLAGTGLLALGGVLIARRGLEEKKNGSSLPPPPVETEV